MSKYVNVCARGYTFISIEHAAGNLAARLRGSIGTVLSQVLQGNAVSVQLFRSCSMTVS